MQYFVTYQPWQILHLEEYLRRKNGRKKNHRKTCTDNTCVCTNKWASPNALCNSTSQSILPHKRGGQNEVAAHAGLLVPICKVRFAVIMWKAKAPTGQCLALRNMSYSKPASIFELPQKHAPQKLCPRTLTDFADGPSENRILSPSNGIGAACRHYNSNIYEIKVETKFHAGSQSEIKVVNFNFISIFPKTTSAGP